MGISRRQLMKGAAGAGVVGVAGAMGISPASASVHDATGEGQYSLFKKFKGNVILLPGKYNGTVSALDLSVPETLAWYNYGLYGIDMPIPHHICAMPAADPYQGFDFYQTMQPPGAPYVNENSPEWRDRGDFKMFKMRYVANETQNSIRVVNDISATTGMALGVHTSLGVGPNAKKYVAFADGQKDMVLITTIDDDPKIVAAFRADYDPVARQLNVSHVFPDSATGKFDYAGRKGMKVTHEAMLGEELMPANPTSVFIDAFTWHPELPLGAILIRRLGCCAIVNTETWEVVDLLSTAKGSPDRLPLAKHQGYTWTFSVPSVLTPLHEAGFSTSGEYFLACNNVLQNNIGVFRADDPNPRKWKKAHFVEGFGRTHLPLHMGNLPDSRWLFFTMWARKPNVGYICKIDPKTWEIAHKWTTGPDPHTCDCTRDGQYITTVYSGNQAGQSGLVVIDVDSNEIVARLPSPAGHHDHVVVPESWEGLKSSRSTSV
ncbi:MAG: twin-arginine translocation signal domain-containing protein [Sinobacteraceae bacterium]|nr:twin-arginine translocation signal domain-containing protein [Nevskiaceae bacterium]